MRKLAICLAATHFFVLTLAYPVAAINLVWDDSGNDASKEWSITGNWNPDNLPDSTDDLFIGVDNLGANVANAANDATIVDQNFIVNSITLGNGADIVNSIDSGTTTTEIQVDLGVTVGNGTGTSIITLFDANPLAESLDANTLTINDGGEVRLDSDNALGDLAILNVDGGLLDINSGGTLFGNGRIDLTDSAAVATTLLQNDGTLAAGAVGGVLFPPATTLQITASDADARIDLDGVNGAGTVNVNRNATLDIDITVGDGAIADAFNGTMNLSAGAALDIAGPWSFSGTMNVNTPGTIIGTGGPTARLAGGAIAMTGGTITLNDGLDLLTLDAALTSTGGIINNSGTIIVNSFSTIGAGTDINMLGADSKLTVNGTLNIDRADFNLDGAEAAGNITTINAGGILDLDLGVGADLSYGHTINMNGGELDVTSSAVTAWTLNSIGTINAAGGATSTINSASETFNIDGSINVTANSTLVISSVSDFSSTADVAIDAGSTLNMATVTYNGGSYTGGGILRKGTATIAAPTTWSVSTVDLDDGTTTVNANLTINADAIEDPGDGFDGIMTVADAALLTVNIGGGGPWTVDPAGIINYNGVAGSNTFLAGSNVVLNGTLNIFGAGQTNAALNIGTGTIDLTASLALGGGNNTTNPNTIAGGTIGGLGTLSSFGARALVGFGAINAPIAFSGFAALRANDGTLTINSAISDVGLIGTSDADGILNVVPAWNSSVADTVDLLGGELRGGAVTIDNPNGITGFGLISSRVVNNTRIRAQGGQTLIVQTAGNDNDWDGTTNTGELSAGTGNLEVRDNASFIFRGTVSANTGRQVFANGFELDFEPVSTLSLTGGTYRSTNSTDIGGTVTTGAGTSTLQIAGTALFESTSNTTLIGDLRFDNTATQINGGATFSGAGALINVAGRPLTVADGADVDVLLQNDGSLALGSSAGQTQGLDFSQSSSGAWNVQLGGTGLTAYDRMTLTGLATLDGALNLSLIGGYVPSLADPLLTILTASTLSGTFDSVIQPAGMPAGLIFDVIYDYDADNVQLMVSEQLQLLGDYNEDDTVDAADYVVWRKNDGTMNTLPNDAIGGMIGDAQYDQWSTHFGETLGGSGEALSAATVPEPGSAFLIVLGIAMAGRRGRPLVEHLP